ncbi:phage portal protein [Weissella coleopterorum]|uniref:Phage portal protein n=1 Tax=Weissella coleopterorum TaxID=2714949 RepID=A0A6G8AYC3_9LACO|nr:phage portal protein [Weissella coleopterorum]QIL50101.1 phage portal protein [Weissella coleopterorum]
MALKFNADNLSADENDVFYFDQTDNEILSNEELGELISVHSRKIVKRFNKLMRYYLGRHDILNKPNKSKGKPDNRIVVNFAKEIVDNEVGYFAGTPVKFDYDENGIQNKEIDKKIADFVNMNMLSDTVAELAKHVDIFGRSNLLLYQDENANTLVNTIDPRQSFVVYDTSINKNMVFGIYYNQLKRNGSVSGVLYTKTKSIDFGGDISGNITFGDEKDNVFQDIPLIEFYASTERQGLFEQVISLIDSVEQAFSNKNNDIDYFANTIMKVINASIDQKNVEAMIDKRLLNIPSVSSENGNVDIDFLNKPDADNIQEHFLERAIDFIYSKANSANFNDEVFGNASGTALEFKLQSMSNAAGMKERKFKTSLQQVFKLGFQVGASLPHNPGAEKYVNMTFKRTVPHNVQDEANTAKTLLEVTDERTALSALSIVDDPDAVMEAKKQDQKVKTKGMLDMVQQNETSDNAVSDKE